MQDRYTGDIGDFGKYSLLRYILDRADINLGINWYLVSNEAHNDDGKHIAYLLDEKLNHKEYKSCDPDLYDILHEIVRPIRKDNGNIVSTGIRRVDRIEKSRIFNKDKVSFYNKRLSPEVDRNDWFNKGLEKLKKCDVIFLDPDNGLEVKSHSKASSKSVKYVYYDEVLKGLSTKKSLMIYQHRDRTPQKKFHEKIWLLAKRVKAVYSHCDIFSIRFNRYSVREFIFVLQENHSMVKNTIGRSFLKSKWGRGKNPHFTFSEQF